MTKRYLPGAGEPGKYNVDYDALEHLLIAIIDGIGDTGTERRIRLRRAYEALTGVRIDRVDEPDSIIAQAMAEYFRQEEENFDHQVLPEFGGPELTEASDLKDFNDRAVYYLAKEAAKNFAEHDKDGNFAEYIYKRMKGTYRNQLLREDPLGYNTALAEQHYSFDKDLLHDLRADLTEIRRILKKYNIPMRLDRQFWRLKR
jgi:hypothetical protein